MNNKSVRVPEGSFRSPLLYIAASFCALSVLAGLCSIFLLFIPGSRMYLITDYLANDARESWSFIHTGLVIFATLWVALMAAVLISALAKRIDLGMELISHGATILRGAIAVIGIGALALFVFRVIITSIIYIRIDGGILLLLPVLLAEFMLAALAVAVVLFLRRALECISDTVSSIARTITSGILRRPSISLFSAVSLLIMGLASLLLGINRLTTVSAWISGGRIPSVYSFMLYATAVLFFTGCVAELLLALYLNKYKRTGEYLLYKEPAIEEENGISGSN